VAEATTLTNEGLRTKLEDYLFSMPEPQTEYDCLLTGLVLMSSAETKSQFNEAKSIVLEVSPLLSDDDNLKALNFVKNLMAQSFLGLE
jgi:hypothetical protein